MLHNLYYCSVVAVIVYRHEIAITRQKKIWESRAEIWKFIGFVKRWKRWLDVGYNIVHIDDCWAVKQRNNKTGKIDPDPERLVFIAVVDFELELRFPHGMKALGDYIHKLGLQFGIYGDMGTHTCGGYPGSMGYEDRFRF